LLQYSHLYTDTESYPVVFALFSFRNDAGTYDVDSFSNVDLYQGQPSLKPLTFGSDAAGVAAESNLVHSRTLAPTEYDKGTLTRSFVPEAQCIAQGDLILFRTSSFRRHICNDPLAQFGVASQNSPSARTFEDKPALDGFPSLELGTAAIMKGTSSPGEVIEGGFIVGTTLGLHELLNQN